MIEKLRISVIQSIALHVTVFIFELRHHPGLSDVYIWSHKALNSTIPNRWKLDRLCLRKQSILFTFAIYSLSLVCLCTSALYIPYISESTMLPSLPCSPSETNRGESELTRPGKGSRLWGNEPTQWCDSVPNVYRRADTDRRGRGLKGGCLSTLLENKTWENLGHRRWCIAKWTSNKPGL